MLILHLSLAAQAKRNEFIKEGFNGKIIERTYLDLNTDIIVSGETLLYKISVQMKFSDSLNQSKIAYITLIDENKKSWFAHKVALKNGTGSGSYRIPVDAKSGNYKLISYTNWSMNNKESGYFVKDILIINPFLKPESKATSATDKYILSAQNEDSISTENSSDGLDIKFNKKIYGTREAVKVSVNSFKDSMGGSYLFSVRKVSPVIPQQQITQKYLGDLDKSHTYLPEFRGELLSGTIIHKDQKLPIENKTVSLSIPGQNFIFKNVNTDTNGHFLIQLDKPYATTKCILQVIDKNPDTYNIILDNNYPKIFDQLKFRELKLEKNLQKWLDKRSIDIQIMNSYAETLYKNNAHNVPEDLFYFPYAKRYKLDDYDRFPTMHQTFTEIIEEAAMREDQNQVQLKIYNNENPFNDGLDKIDPLVLIDGIQIQDYHLVKNLDPGNVEYVDIVPLQYRYGPSYFNGIISVLTKNRSFILPKKEGRSQVFEISLPKTDSEFFEKYYTKLPNDKRIPDYRIQLFWDPNFDLSSQMLFYTSDIEGVFEILLKGYNNKGIAVEIRKRFKVESVD